MSAITHLDAQGAAHMVDVSAKASTVRVAIAEAVIDIGKAAFKALTTGSAPKGDVLATARIAGIMAAKRTAELIPLCHPLPISTVAIDVVLDKSASAVRLTATVKTTGQTGVEMEALTAASVAALTIYDMLKAIDKTMSITCVRLLSKSGGKSGDWQR